MISHSNLIRSIIPLSFARGRGTIYRLIRLVSWQLQLFLTVESPQAREYVCHSFLGGVLEKKG
jgi:hypothetical protein